jgi:hypothetical protein
MPRNLRVEYEEALHHVMSRGDRREAIFHGDEDRQLFLETLGQACRKTGRQVQAWCLAPNHFHLVVETSKANLSVGMQWPRRPPLPNALLQRCSGGEGASPIGFQGRVLSHSDIDRVCRI